MAVRKIAQYQIIDKYQKVTTIQEAVINPAATAEAVKPLLEALPETVQVKAITQKILAQQEIMQDENRKGAEKQKANPKADISAEEARWNQAKANVRVEERNLMPLIEKIEAARIELYEKNAVYFGVNTGEKLLNPAEEADLTAKFSALEEHEALTLAGEIIPDNRGVEYWKKTNGAWTKLKIEKLGIPLPAGAVLQDALKDSDKAEIAAQKEAARIAALDADARTAEKQSRLDALADEADRLSRRAVIQGKAFDPAAWYAEKQAETEAVYA
jgi:hypothetical protein